MRIWESQYRKHVSETDVWHLKAPVLLESRQRGAQAVCRCCKCQHRIWTLDAERYRLQGFLVAAAILAPGPALPPSPRGAPISKRCHSKKTKRSVYTPSELLLFPFLVSLSFFFFVFSSLQNISDRWGLSKGSLKISDRHSP